MLVLSSGGWKSSDDQVSAFLQQYVADLPHHLLGLVVKKSECFPYIMDVHKSTTKGSSVGSPRDVMKVVLRSVIGETRLLLEHRNRTNFHVLCLDIVVDSKTALRIGDKQLTALNEEHPEVD